MDDTLIDDIITSEDRPFEDVVVPEWKNRTLRIVVLPGTERDAWEISLVKVENGKAVPNRHNFRARLLVRCIADPKSGERVFKDGHAEILGTKSGDVIARLFAVASRLNRLNPEDVEELGKGSALIQSADSGSA